MKVIFITPPELVPEEIETIEGLFQEGLHFLHLRKPGWRDDELEKYIDQLPVDWMDKTSIHGHPELARKIGAGGVHLPATVSEDSLVNWPGIKSRSVHSTEEIAGLETHFDYFFLSPIFDSISKRGYKSHFNLYNLEKWLKMPRPFEVFALGGIDESNTGKVVSMGFDGVALLGAVWRHEEKTKRIEAFRKIVQKCRTATGTY